MKRITVILLALVVAVGAVVGPSATAGMFKKDKPKRTEKPEHMKKPRRFDDGPRMSFHAGELQQGFGNGWQLGDLTLQLAADCLITTNGDEVGALSAGRQAVVMGSRIGDTIVARSVQVRGRESSPLKNYGSDVQVTISETNPNCGKIVSASE